MRIAEMLPLILELGEDTMFWALSSLEFIINSVYKFLQKDVPSHSIGLVKLTWNWYGPHRMKMFL